MIDPKLEGKVAVVTGANNPWGIGAGIARAFAMQGARVFLHYFRPRSGEGKRRPVPNKADSPGEAFYWELQMRPPDEVLQEIRGMGREARAWEADLADPEAVPELFDRAESDLGPVDVLVNNAAHWEGDTFIPSAERLVNKSFEPWTSPPAVLSAQGMERLFSVNAMAPALLVAEFARRHIQRNASWGRVINVSTDGAYCFPSEISYGASKLALEGYTRSAAIELGQFGITVNVLSLGPVQTGWITPELEKSVLPVIPLGRIGTPEDVADVVVFLASEQARWLTGQKIYLGGGHAV